jgi:hypothetical protein
MSMSEREQRQVIETQDDLFPAVRKAAGRELSKTEYTAGNKAVREYHASGNGAPVVEWVKRVTRRVRFLEEEPLAQARRLVAEDDAKLALPTLSEAEFSRALDEAVSAGHRSPGLASPAVREMSASRPALNETVPTGRYAFGEAAMAGRLGSARSPGLAPPASKVSEAAMPDAREIGRMPELEGDEVRRRLIAATWPQR